MNGIKRVIAMGAAVLLLLQMTACNTASTVREYTIPDIAVTDSKVVAENDTYRMRWDDAQKCVLLENKATGYIWSTVAYDYYQEEKANVNINSPLFIDYYIPDEGSLMIAKAFSECIDFGNLAVTEIDDGLKMMFYFEEAEITIPVYFRLREDSLAVSVPLAEVEESGRSQLTAVSLLPYFCSAKNTADRSSYLMLPTGSGALMYTDTETQTVSRVYTGSVYGNDAAAMRLIHAADEQPIRMPVYGVKDGNEALFAIIEQGEGSCDITAEAGNSRNGHSAVYATMQVRGKDETEAVRNNYNDVYIYNAVYNPEQTLSVGYYPLTGEDANYGGMAKRYRAYLQEKGLLSEPADSVKQEAYSVNFLGGAYVKKFFLGFPYHDLLTTTTLSQAQTIAEELKAATGVTPSLKLTGFGGYGVDSGKVAGGYKIASQAGGNKGLKKLEAYCADNGMPLFTDFDLIHLSATGSGFLKLFDTAKTSSKQSAAFYPLYANVRTENKTLTKVRLLKRAKLGKAIDKLNSYTKNTVSGVSLASLGSVAYSDYSELATYTQGGLQDQIAPLLNSVRQAGHVLACSDANAYAAAVADVIHDVPLQNGDYVVFDDTIPFYAMVFGADSALYSPALNLSANADKLLLRAVEAGVSPSFTVAQTYDSDLADTADYYFYGTKYDDHKDEIVRTVKDHAAYFEAVAGQSIVKHEILENGVTKTTFSGGTTVLVNHTDTAVTADGVTLEAGSFRYDG